MTHTETLTPTQDERIMAALAHIAVLLPMIGVIAPIVIWVTQKDKSRYVAFQALQAVVFHIVMIVGYMAGMLLYFLSGLGMMFITIASSGFGPSSDPSPLVGGMFFFPFLIFGAILLGGLLFVIYGIVAAVMTFQGKPFRYPLIGPWVERLTRPQTGEPA